MRVKRYNSIVLIVKNGENGNSLPSRLVDNKYYLDILTYVTN